MRTIVITILSVLTLDQALKLWVKMNFLYGENLELIPGTLDLQFVENPGMAFGWMFPGTTGKLALSIFRIIVVGGIFYYVYTLLKKKTHKGFLFSLALIIAGALGNIIDSAAYGLIFDRGSVYDAHYQDYIAYSGIAEANGGGYAPFLMGNVVDMIHLTTEITYPSWSPIHAGQTRELFPPVFNIADSAITVGIILILLFQKRFFREEEHAEMIVEENQNVSEGNA